MSGIYIPNTKPPTACCACPCSYDNQCAVNNEYPTFAEWYEDKPKWCPLIPVPDHGRLIDADVLFKKARYRMGITPGGIDEVEAFIRATDLLDAPTIIESEGEDEMC